MPQSIKDASHLYEVERRARHAERDGFRISELTISSTQKVPWHCHTHVTDTFYLLDGEITIYLRDPKETRVLQPGECFPVLPKRPHLVINSGDTAATFMILQGLGEYDYVPLT